MKNIFYLITIILLFSSCSKYLDVNESPNNFIDEQVSADDMLAGVILGTQYWQTSNGTRITMMWMNQANGAANQYESVENWNMVTASEFNNVWNTAYKNSMSDATEMYIKAMQEGRPKLAGVALILKAQTLGMVASLWGDVPFSQTFNYDSYPNPVYDSQLSVYNYTQNLLDQGIELLHQESNYGITGDFVYSGDILKWEKLANTLKARFYLHLKNYQAALNIINNYPVLNYYLDTSTSDIVVKNDDYNAIFLDSGGAYNPFWQFGDSTYGTRQGYMDANETYAVNLLTVGNADYRGHDVSSIPSANRRTDERKRLSFIYSGTINTTKDLNYGSKFGKDADLPLVTVGEVLLIKAECQARLTSGNDFTEALTTYNLYRDLLRKGYSIGKKDSDVNDNYYKNYIETDFNQGNIENKAPMQLLTPKEAFLRELYQERYVYFIGHYESFTDYRRTNNLAEIKLRNFEGSPQRFLYAQDEVNSNSSVPSPIPSANVKTPVHL